MKKIYLTLLAALAVCLSANAQKFYSGGVDFSEKGYKIILDNEKTIKTTAEKKAAKKYIVSVLKKCLGDDFLKKGIKYKKGLEYLTYCVDDLKTYLKELGPRWRPNWIKPQYLKKDYLIVFAITGHEGAVGSSYDLIGVYDTKTGRVYDYDEASGGYDRIYAFPYCN